MPASDKNSKSNGSSDAIINADNHCNFVNTEDGAKMVFENKNNDNSNGHTSIGGKTLRAHQASLPNNGFHAEYSMAPQQQELPSARIYKNC